MYLDPAVRGAAMGRCRWPISKIRAGMAGYCEVLVETGTEQPEAIALYVSSGYGPCAALRRVQGRSPQPLLHAPVDRLSETRTLERPGRLTSAGRSPWVRRRPGRMAARMTRVPTDYCSAHGAAGLFDARR